MRSPELSDPDREWTEDDARVALDEWRRSGKTIAVFARERRMSAPRLYWWRRRLSSRTMTSSTVSLVPATIVAATVATSVVIRLPNGIAIEVANGGVSPSWIAEVVSELARSSP